MKYVVYTDLDGTLLDHHDYSFEAALPALGLLSQKQIPVVPVTSKTRAELEPLRIELGLATPFIIENGSAVYIPKSANKLTTSEKLPEVDEYWVKKFSPDIVYWTSVVEELQLLLPNCFSAFSQLSLDEVVDLTSLTHEQASRARNREFSDPLYWFGNETQFSQLESHCALLEIEVVRGGRFVHMLKGADKGKALTWLHTNYQRSEDVNYVSIALGDGDNDIAMLSEVDVPVQIRSESHPFPDFSNKNLYRTIKTGPSGWNEAIQKLITD